MCRLSWNLEASTSWNPQGLSRPGTGLLYYICLKILSNLNVYLISVFPWLSSFIEAIKKMLEILLLYENTSLRALYCLSFWNIRCNSTGFVLITLIIRHVQDCTQHFWGKGAVKWPAVNAVFLWQPCYITRCISHHISYFSADWHAIWFWDMESGKNYNLKATSIR